MSKEEQLREQIKRKLHRYNATRWECKQIADQLEQLRATAESPRSQAMDGMPHGSGGGGDAMAGLVAELVALQEKYLDKLHRLNAALAEVEDMIDSLEDPTERRLMRCRYISGMAWEEVCVEMCYSWRQTHRIHGVALGRLVQAEMERQGIPPEPEPEQDPKPEPDPCDGCEGGDCYHCKYGDDR